eukprot:12096875-Alexandrium_andersonii.AAC.1
MPSPQGLCETSAHGQAQAGRSALDGLDNSALGGCRPVAVREEGHGCWVVLGALCPNSADA